MIKEFLTSAAIVAMPIPAHGGVIEKDSSRGEVCTQHVIDIREGLEAAISQGDKAQHQENYPAPFNNPEDFPNNQPATIPTGTRPAILTRKKDGDSTSELVPERYSPLEATIHLPA